jgi:hypothetical protein
MISYIKNSNPKKPLLGIEIGVLHAENAYSIMTNLPMKTLYLIDPYEMYEDDINKYQDRERDFEIAQQRMKPFGDTVEFIREPSEVAYKEFLPGPYKPIVDFVYIDGNHTYDYVKRDIELYYPLIKSGGVIGGHDFRADCIGLCNAVIEFAKKNNLKIQGFKMDWWMVKP